ncbi:hypothetical protein [Mesorhizobium sp. AaZ16]|uniref:hypothetical protein n=1 Tax=Mesorhizobium sp. AaZ16 TaxID=3402289 RepID=UPI00374E4E71
MIGGDDDNDQGHEHDNHADDVGADVANDDDADHAVADAPIVLVLMPITALIVIAL